ncbi:hypothetical protein D8824_04845 [Streptococcus intermedius]|uniref:hypothetical protein n=1 Tax=Streptococcus intermedius TaxID=1338 RepID=UPI00029C48B7|nr:hypothetical protein [Streptococcus intermedius]EKU18094.1 hypothetical protein D593_0089 [Streptococcus intermedius BA1]RSJ09629.1 hypothetical protein D8833_07260 [Streptococcus intermedius]RSJ16054.1 hypothetical protein D8831_04845 [Streptococcus intermedius]RSJ30803.1 hypothetical protein D8824_04845 [Streptococcus intermedius]
MNNRNDKIEHLADSIKEEILKNYCDQIPYNGPVKEIYEFIQNPFNSKRKLKKLVKMFVDETGDYNSKIIYDLEKIYNELNLK